MERRPDVDAKALQAVLGRAFGTAAAIAAGRTPEGVSAQVYRIERAGEVFYLRVAEEHGQDLSVDAELARELRRRGVRVPEVLFVEPFAAELDRSVLIMAEVAGVALAPGSGGEVAHGIARAAGQDLARLNQMSVDGFGWIRREAGRAAGEPFAAELPTYADFVVAHLPSPWPGQLASLWSPAELAQLEALIEIERRAPHPQGCLAHGDFDTTQIFHQGGRYTGMIDLGEVRGAEPCFDLGHFLLQRGDGTTSLLQPLIAGYREVAALPVETGEAIRRSAVLLGLRQLCRWIGAARQLSLGHEAVRARAQRLRELLVERPDL